MTLIKDSTKLNLTSGLLLGVTARKRKGKLCCPALFPNPPPPGSPALRPSTEGLRLRLTPGGKKDTV